MTPFTKMEQDKKEIYNILKDVIVTFRNQKYKVFFVKGSFSVYLIMSNGDLCQMYHIENVVPVLKKAFKLIGDEKNG